MKTYLKAIAFVILWLSGWSYLISYESKFAPGVNGPVGRDEFIDSINNRTGLAGDTLYIVTDTLVIGSSITDTAMALRAEMLDSAAEVVEDSLAVWVPQLQSEMQDSSARAAADTANVLRAEMQDSAAVAAGDTAAVLRGVMSDTADVLRLEMLDSAACVVKDTADLLRAEMQDSSARAASDTATVLRLYAEGVARDSAHDAAADTAVVLRAFAMDVVEDSLATWIPQLRGEMQDSSGRVVGDSLVEVRSLIDANTTPAEVADIVEDSLVEIRAEMLDSAAVVSGDTAAVLRAEMQDSSARAVGDTANILRAEMPDTAGRVVGDTASVLRTEIQGIVGDTASILRAEMSDSAAVIVSDSLAAADSLHNKKLISVLSDSSYSGEVISLMAGEDLTFGEVVYIKADGKMWLADADAAATMPARYMALATISADSYGLFLRSGIVRCSGWGAEAPGSYVYTGLTAGAITTTQVSAAGDQSQKLGVLIDSTVVDFDPDMTVLEVK